MAKDTIIIFSDKKLFVVDGCPYAKTHCVVPEGTEALPILRTKHPASVMMLGVVGSDGQKMPPYFFEKGLKINTKVYLKVMKKVVFPWIKQTYPEDNTIYQQDSAPAHGAILTQKWCRENLPDFIPKEMWPPSSPDANPLDYGIWSYIEKRACADSHPNVDSLKASICREWEDMPNQYVAKTCDAFIGRIEAIIEANGGHIEGKRK